MVDSLEPTDSAGRPVVRRATRADIPRLEALIDASVRGLGPAQYSDRQIERSLAQLFGVDTQLIDDGTYYVVESDYVVESEQPGESPLVGCGGWSRRKTPFGGDQAEAQDHALRDPTSDPAVIRAFFVHPEAVRQGIGRRMLAVCEQAARDAGFDRFELTATLTGLAFYRAHGYRDIEAIEIPLGEGEVLEAVRMRKPYRGKDNEEKETGQ